MLFGDPHQEPMVSHVPNGYFALWDPVSGNYTNVADSCHSKIEHIFLFFHQKHMHKNFFRLN